MDETQLAFCSCLWSAMILKQDSAKILTMGGGTKKERTRKGSEARDIIDGPVSGKEKVEIEFLRPFVLPAQLPQAGKTDHLSRLVGVVTAVLQAPDNEKPPILSIHI